MTPRRFAVFILSLLIPAVLWVSAFNGREDLQLRTRSFMSQAKKDRPGKFEGFAQMCRLPDAHPGEADGMLYRLWNTFKSCTPEKTGYGSRQPVRLGDGREHEHREVVVTARDPRGEVVRFNVDWVRYMGNWYIHGFTGYEARARPNPGAGYGLPPGALIAN